jgi:AraC family transcriptional regulator of adaptative response/methylated-DNA-[protein]-cysteine methyltransferase
MQLMTVNLIQQWAQVLARDASADGQFVYAVRSTGVFCRPSCPSRRPRREMVEFFQTPAQAQNAGYRACFRCEPTQPPSYAKKVEAACRYIESNMETTIRLSDVAGHVEMSPFYFQRLFKRTLGISPREYQQALRVKKFKSALHSEARITDAVYEAGYSSSSRAYENVSAQLGMTPSAFRRKGAGTKINYSIFPTELGQVLIAATDRGLCAVRFGDDDAELQKELRGEFDAAELVRDDEHLSTLSEQIRSLLRGGLNPAEIPLDVQGTAFQQLVWNALRQIPRGQTRSYSEIAVAVGRPGAVRAVAGACASNPVAVVVPCHRVVQKNGSLSGYRWGTKRKAALLKDEGIESPRHA